MRWTITLPYVMRAHLRDYEPGTDALEELLTRDEVEWLKRPVDGLRAHQPMRAAGAQQISILSCVEKTPVICGTRNSAILYDCQHGDGYLDDIR